MDLISAKVEAAKESRLNNTVLYVMSHADGECTIEKTDKMKKGDILQAIFQNGKEVEEVVTAPATEKEAKGKSPKPENAGKKEKPSKTKSMATKKATGKAAKKAAPKAKGPKVEKVIRGNNMALTKEQWAKVDKKRGDVSFSEFSRTAVLKAIGE